MYNLIDNKRIDEELSINYIVKHYSIFKKKEVLLFVTTRMLLEDIMLEWNKPDSQRQIHHILTYIWNLKNVELIGRE